MYYMTYSMAHFEVRRFKNVLFFSLASHSVHFSPIPIACRGFAVLCFSSAPQSKVYLPRIYMALSR